MVLSINLLSAAAAESRPGITENKDAVLQLASEDIPEAVSVNEVETYGHVQRLYEQEKDLNTVVFQNEDGTKTMYYFTEPVKYIDENGTVQDKSNTLTLKAVNARSAASGYANENNDVHTYFPNALSTETGVVLEKDEINLELTPITIGKARTINTAKKVLVSDERGAEDEAVSYENVFGTATEIRYTPLLNGFKEEIILDSYSGVNEFAFVLKTNGLQMRQEAGHWYLVNPETKENVVNVGDLLVYDSSVKEENDTAQGDYEHQYVVETLEVNEEYKITIVIDEEFLTDSHTVYPVIIDPSFDVISSNNGIMDIYVSQAGTIVKGNKLLVGKLDSGNTVYRAFIKFPGLLESWEFAALAPSGYGNSNFPEITSLTLSLYNISSGWADSPVDAYLYSGSNAVNWNYTSNGISPTSFTSANYNAKDNLASSTTIKVAAGWNDINLTSISDFDLSKGIVIQNRYEGSGDEDVLKEFHSTRNTNKPKITVTWRELEHTSFANAKAATLNAEYYVPVLEENTKYYFSFTPSTPGLYTIESNYVAAGEPSGMLYNSSQVLLKTDDSGDGKLQITYHLDSGKKYYFATGCEETGRYRFKITADTELSNVFWSDELTIGAVKQSAINSARERQFYRFTATTAGTYVFESSNRGTSDPYGWLYDSNANLISSNDDGAGDRNFKITCDLAAGEEVCLVTGCYGTGTGSYAVSVSQTFMRKEITQTLNEGEYLTIPIGVSNASDLSSIEFSVGFDSEDFELVNACDFVNTPVLSTGVVSTTNVHITSVSENSVSFVNSTSAPTRPGVVNVVVLKAIRTGTLSVACEAKK